MPLTDFFPYIYLICLITNLQLKLHQREFLKPLMTACNQCTLAAVLLMQAITWF